MQDTALLLRQNKPCVLASSPGGFPGCWCGTAEDCESQLLLWRWPVLHQVRWESFCRVCCRKQSGRAIDPVTDFHLFPLQLVHTHACRPLVPSQKRARVAGLLLPFTALSLQWAATLGSGNAIPGGKRVLSIGGATPSLRQLRGKWTHSFSVRANLEGIAPGCSNLPPGQMWSLLGHPLNWIFTQPFADDAMRWCWSGAIPTYFLNCQQQLVMRDLDLNAVKNR